jgi:hypothetical protein
MMLHVTKVGNVLVQVRDDHPWSPADQYTLVIRVGSRNSLCLSFNQLSALKSAIAQCEEWIADERQSPCAKPRPDYAREEPT